MCRTYCIVATLLAMIPACSTASDPISFPTEWPEHLVKYVLVAGHVVAVDRDGPKVLIPVTVRAERVYWGDRKYIGHLFQDSYIIVGSRFDEGSMPMTPGDTGLWLIQVPRDDRYPMRTKYRVLAKKEKRDFANALEVARFLETVYPANKADREKLARAAVGHREPGVGRSAVHILAAYAENPGKALLAVTEIKGLDLRVQLTVDELLCEKKVPGWGGTKRRKAWVHEWLPQVTNDEKYRALGTALYSRVQSSSGNKISSEFAIDAFLQCSRNTKLSDRSRKHAVGDIGSVAYRTGDVDNAFRAIVRVLTEGDPTELRREAAASLPHFIQEKPDRITLSTDQIDKLNELLRTEKDKVVADHMAEAVRKATDAKSRDKKR
jgi:hypothetical protein